MLSRVVRFVIVDGVGVELPLGIVGSQLILARMLLRAFVKWLFVVGAIAKSEGCGRVHQQIMQCFVPIVGLRDWSSRDVCMGHLVDGCNFS